MEHHKPDIKRIVLIVVVVFIFLSILSFAFRGMLLAKAIRSVNKRLSAYNYVTHWDGARFKGLRTVYVSGVYVQSRSGDNEVFADEVSLQVKILPLFFRNIRIRKLECNTVTIRYFTEGSMSESVSAGDSDSTLIPASFLQKDLATVAGNMIRRLFRFAPQKAVINRADLRITSSGNTSVVGLHHLQLNNDNFSAQLVFAGNASVTEIPCKGIFDKNRELLTFDMANADTGMLPIPILKDKYGLSAGFDSLRLDILMSQKNRHLLELKGGFSIVGFEVGGERLSTINVEIDGFSSSFLVHIGSDFAEVDSSTRVKLNAVTFRPWLRLSLENEPLVSFRILPARWNAGDFFSSLPAGMFTSLAGLRAVGTLYYQLDCQVNLQQPDSLVFETSLRASGFRILNYGNDNYTMLNGDFIHHVYEKDQLKTSFPVGPENPYFTPFEDISPYLKAAVMTSEDGSFFSHHGFNPEAFRVSMAANIKERRFARGGSTISMQLVKNVFLTRNKTVARKIEEALIVWLIENEHLVSKQRMYEVYLNIIEWGPGVYGIGEASRFYFDKSPAELGLSESIFLASIVPHPKWYRYTFKTNGITREFFGSFSRRLAGLMLKRERISPSDTLALDPMILLKGPAAAVFDTTVNSEQDSVRLENLEIEAEF